MREIVLDTETTGLDPYQGHRVVEIGCVELFNRIPTGQNFHRYVNPEREMPAEAFAVHGLSAEFLKDHSCFAEVVDELLQFVGDAPLIIHNAAFDLAFLNAELERCGRPLIVRDRLVDTLLLARRKHPAGANSLDQLCARYAIDNSRRTKHGALLDAEILAEVYIELIGARQAQLGLGETITIAGAGRDGRAVIRVRPTPLLPRLTDAERAAHLDYVATLGANAIWHEYLAPRVDARAATA
ncbi:MAG: DNA polymerase III subunit epsilon [Xanthobacteraceae bacterium]